ncbi:MAG: CBS domain-containing protein [Litoricola sp.]|jgi:CBS domain-containing protein|nr:CBS domain-containing protein [Litorivicinus sp.]MBL6809125.1 CBS domain-containing protein [Litorivicinus sp.]MBL6825409.1 CBS domain-containing protein [Litorivicinus sp.]
MFRSILVDDFMTTHLATAKPEMDLLALVDLLLIQGISGAPVVDQDGKLVGMISEQDCLRKILVGTYQGDIGGRVEDAMTSPVETVKMGASIVEVAEQMLMTNRRRFPVVDLEGRLKGQISRRDLLKAVRAYEIPNTHPE